MDNRIPAALALSVVAALSAAGTAQGALIEFQYSGFIVSVVGTPDAPFDGVVNSDTFTYTVRLDTTAATSTTPDFYAGAVGTHYDAVMQAGLQVGGVDFPFGPLPAGFEGSAFVANDSDGNDILTSFVHVDGFVQIGVALFDSDMQALSDEEIPTSISPDWDSDQSALYINFGETLGTGRGMILGVITEATSAVVPTPGALALFGLAGLALSRRRR